MLAMIKLYPDYIDDVIAKKHMMPINTKGKTNKAAAPVAAAPGVAAAAAATATTQTDEWVPSSTTKEEEARTDGNLDMILTTVNIASRNGELHPNEEGQHGDRLEGWKIIRLFELNEDSKFRFFDVVDSVVNNKIYYRPRSTIDKKAKAPAKRSATDMAKVPIPFEANIMIERAKTARESGDPEQMKAELGNYEILLHNKVLKGGKAFKPTNKTTDDCLKFLQDIAPDDDSMNQKMPAQKKAKNDNTNATAV
jgi:hypothetical protein